MLEQFNRFVIQPLVALRRRSRHLAYLNRLEQSQYDAPEVIRARQLAMLKRVVAHAHATVPYYHRVWTGFHPADMNSLTDFRRLPILTKADIRTAAGQLLSSSFKIDKLRIKKTSGSTGVPLTIHLDERGAQWKTACTLRADQWSGWRLGQRVAKVWGNPDYLHGGLRGRITNFLVDRAVHLDTRLVTPERIRTFVNALRKHRPGLIFGHAHSLYLLADELKRSEVEDIRPNGIISTAMPLHDWQRRVIEEVFGIRVTNRYGCEEVSLIACECEQHNGLHIAAESVFVETDADGKLLVTDLSNFAMPLIRYQIGDVATLTDRVCPCGRGLPLLERIEGRDADYVVTPSGDRISGSPQTPNTPNNIAGAAQLQLVQENVTFLKIRMVKDQRYDESSDRGIARLVRETFGPKMRHEVEFVESIPQEASGKYRFCISKVDRDAGV